MFEHHFDKMITSRKLKAFFLLLLLTIIAFVIYFSVMRSANKLRLQYPNVDCDRLWERYAKGSGDMEYFAKEEWYHLFKTENDYEAFQAVNTNHLQCFCN